MSAKSPIVCIKEYFQRDDAQAPGGGREVKMPELKQLSQEERVYIGGLCAKELGCELAPAGG